MKFIKNNIGYLSLFILLFLFNLFCIIDSKVAITDQHKILIFIVSIILEITLVILYYYMDKKKIAIHNKFLVSAIFLGTLYMLVIPITRVPDEFNHFLRAYEISEGHLISKQDSETLHGGRELSTSFSDMQINNYEQLGKVLMEKQAGTNQFYYFSNTSLYSPICYLPQTIGILLGKALNLPFTIQAYMGRIVNFMVYLAIMYLSIKYIPFKKNLILMVSLLPITIQESMSLSPDALTIAISIALISFVLYMKYSKKGEMNNKEISLMIMLPLILALCKIVYVPLSLLLFLIPKEKFGTLKRKKLIIIFTIILAIVINLFWTSQVSKFLDAHINNSSSREQISYILHNPFEYAKICFRTLDKHAEFYIFGLMGKFLSYYDVILYAPYIYASMALLCILLFGNSEKEKIFEIKSKVLMGIIFSSIVVLILTSIYVQWTSLKYKYIDGVQGRYFIPIILLLGLILSNKKIKVNMDMSNKFILLFIGMENVMALIALISNFSI